jgi:hypothetical protein
MFCLILFCGLADMGSGTRTATRVRLQESGDLLDNNLVIEDLNDYHTTGERRHERDAREQRHWECHEQHEEDDKHLRILYLPMWSSLSLRAVGYSADVDA